MKTNVSLAKQTSTIVAVDESCGGASSGSGISQRIKVSNGARFAFYIVHIRGIYQLEVEYLMCCSNRGSCLFFVIPSLVAGITFAHAKMGLKGPAFERGERVLGSANIFATPTKNIACRIDGERDEEQLVCQKVSPSYLAIYLKPSGMVAKVTNESESDAGGPYMEDPILVYHTWWSNEHFACLSEENGLTCKNVDQHGFFINGKRHSKF